MEREDNGRSVYSLGAVDGFWVGLTMGLFVVCSVLSTRVSFLSLPAMAIFVFTPYLVWRFLHRGWVKGLVPTLFSAVWLHGICIFLFGAILTALILYVTLAYIWPGWIELQTSLAVQRLSADPETVNQAVTLNKIMETGNLPSPIYLSVTSIWFIAFTGSLWSMIFAFVLTHSSKFRNKRIKNLELQKTQQYEG